MLLLITLLLALCAAVSGIFYFVATQPSQHPRLVAAPGPTPGLSPQQVVEIQLDALRNNDVPQVDTGIAITFRFASPANRQLTGPLKRFTQMVKSPNYRLMLYHKTADVGPTHLKGDQAQIVVRLMTNTNQVVAYAFVLSKQTQELYRGCWMTEAVIRIPDGPHRQPESAKKRIAIYVAPCGMTV